MPELEISLEMYQQIPASLEVVCTLAKQM